MRKIIIAIAVASAITPQAKADSVTAQELPDCESRDVIKVLIRVANQRRVAVYDVQPGPKTYYETPDIKLCAGSAWTSAGVLYVKYNIRWINHETGQWWVTINSYKRTW